MKITIITINFNNCEGLGKTIDSVVSQSCHDYEYIVIDGGSTDGSVNVIKDNADNIDYWVSKKDDGIYNAMNKGIDHATGEYCLFLNSGDTLHDCEVIASVVPVLEADIVVGAIRKCTSGYVKRLKITEPLVLLDFWLENPIPHQSTFIKTEVCRRVRYDETLKIVGDLKFFIQAVLSGCSQQSIDCVVADFDETGISGRVNSDGEWERVFKDVLGTALFDDFKRMYARKYDFFYAKLHLCKYYKIIYTLSVLCIRTLAFLRPTARFARKSPLFIK